MPIKEAANIMSTQSFRQKSNIQFFIDSIFVYMTKLTHTLKFRLRVKRYNSVLLIAHRKIEVSGSSFAKREKFIIGTGSIVPINKIIAYLYAIFVTLPIIWLSCPPVGKTHWHILSHPSPLTFICQFSTSNPKSIPNCYFVNGKLIEMKINRRDEHLEFIISIFINYVLT